MKPATSATIILCALILAAVALVCTGHGDSVRNALLIALAITFFFFL